MNQPSPFSPPPSPAAPSPAIKGACSPYSSRRRRRKPIINPEDFNPANQDTGVLTTTSRRGRPRNKFPHDKKLETAETRRANACATCRKRKVRCHRSHRLGSNIPRTPSQDNGGLGDAPIDDADPYSIPEAQGHAMGTYLEDQTKSQPMIGHIVPPQSGTTRQFTHGTTFNSNHPCNNTSFNSSSLQGGLQSQAYLSGNNSSNAYPYPRSVPGNFMFQSAMPRANLVGDHLAPPQASGRTTPNQQGNVGFQSSYPQLTTTMSLPQHLEGMTQSAGPSHQSNRFVSSTADQQDYQQTTSFPITYTGSQFGARGSWNQTLAYQTAHVQPSSGPKFTLPGVMGQTYDNTSATASQAGWQAQQQYNANHPSMNDWYPAGQGTNLNTPPMLASYDHTNRHGNLALDPYQHPPPSYDVLQPQEAAQYFDRELLEISSSPASNAGTPGHIPTNFSPVQAYGATSELPIRTMARRERDDYTGEAPTQMGMLRDNGPMSMTGLLYSDNIWTDDLYSDDS